MQHREYGLQFKADSLRTTPPHTREGIVKYLGSGLVKGIGPHFARKIVDVFGERTLAVIDESPTFLQEVKGIGKTRIQRIRESWQQQKAVRGIMVFLQSHGVGTRGRCASTRPMATRPSNWCGPIPTGWRRTSGASASRRPTSWRSAWASTAARRSGPARPCATSCSKKAARGTSAFPRRKPSTQAAELTEIDAAVVRGAAEDGRREEELVREPWDGSRPAWLYLKPLFLAEQGAARSLQRCSAGPHPLAGLPAEVALPWVEQRIGLNLAPSQRDAIRQAASHKVLVITGGPGTGKTTLVRGILEMFAAQGKRCVLCAPTGRAAKRLAETTGREAKTIHRLLEFDPRQGGFKHDRDQPLDLDLLVVDEASMVDVPLMNKLAQAVPRHACLVLVGDVDQLPSVGPGSGAGGHHRLGRVSGGAADGDLPPGRGRAGSCVPPTPSTPGNCRSRRRPGRATSTSSRRTSRQASSTAS